jgi:hypothetical protein
MRKTALASVAFLCAVVFSPLFAYGADGPGPVKISSMTRVESHSKIADKNGNYGGETYVYNMISATRQLQKGVIGNVFYLNQYSSDNRRIVTHIGGATVIYVHSPKWIGTVGYTYSSTPQVDLIPLENQDKFSLSLINNFNPKSKGAKFSAITGYSKKADIANYLNRSLSSGNQVTVSEKLGVSFPMINKKFTGDAGYTYSYSFNKDSNAVRLGHLTNQYSANLTYTLNKENRLVLGFLYIDKFFGTPATPSPDDSIFRLTLLHSYN